MSVPRFWREVPQRYHLQASRCGVCAGVYFPPRAICPKCRRESVGQMARFSLAGKGTVVECTRVHRAAPGYEQQVPYWVVLVATDEGPRVVGQLVDADLAEVAPGLAVETAFRRLGEDGPSGVIHYGVKWRPVRTAAVDGDAEE